MTASNTKLLARGVSMPAPSTFRGVAGFWTWRDSLRRRMLALADVGASLAGVATLHFLTKYPERAIWAAPAVPAWLVLAKVFGLYDRDHTAIRHLTVDELPSVFLWTLAASAGTALWLRVTPVGGLSIAEGLRLWLVTSVAAFSLRTLARFAWRHSTPPERALILGEGPLADATRRKLALFPDIHISAVEDQHYSAEELLTEPARILDLRLDRIIIATQSIDEGLIAELVALCRSNHIKLSLVPPAQGMFGTAVRLGRVADLPVLEYNTWDTSRSTLLLKRVLDVSVSLVGLVLLSWLFVLIALAIVLDSRGRVVFSQIRAGRDGLPFRMYKFRSMVLDAEARLPQLVPFDGLPEPVFKLRRDPRITRVGRLLRRSSLDELPQLLNVLKGDMSLVGPRPEQVELVTRYTPEQLYRLAVKPGITGPMQVYGRGYLTLEERLAVERDYIENLSFARDLRILALTIGPVISGRGAF